MNKVELPKLALIAGPTASGKSALALDLARRHDGVIVNADSAQVYDGLRILTARPSEEEERQAPHRLFGYLDPADPCSAPRWTADARAMIADVQAEGRLPILVGGTGLYLRTLIDGIAPVPPIDPAIRAEVRALPVAEAHRLLGELDPPVAARLARADTTRVARALEVVRSTGRPLADWQAERTAGIGDAVDLRAVVLLPERAWLAERIDARLDAMIEGGALDEVAALLARTDLPPDAPVLRAIGVAPLAALLRGELGRDAALARAKLDTRRYAKRQATWFRHQPPANWKLVQGKYATILRKLGIDAYFSDRYPPHPSARER